MVDEQFRIPHPDDIALGARLRLLREAAKISQQKLGADIGVTFQQVMKYEQGITRVSYSRLTEIATAIGMPASEIIAPLEGKMAQKNIEFMMMLGEPYGLEILRALCQITDPKRRKHALEMVRMLGRQTD